MKPASTSSTDLSATINSEEDSISVLEILTALGQQKVWLIVGLFLGICVGLAIALLSKPVFTARTVLLPPQQSSSGSLAASLGALGALAGGMGGALKSADELYVALLKSDSAAESLIKRFDLQNRYEKVTLTDTKKLLAKNISVSSDKKSGLLTVNADDEDPVFAAQLANAHLDELRSILTRVALTEAQQRQQYYKDQMTKARNDLTQAEAAFKQAQAKSGLASIDSQTQTTITASAQLRGQIVAKEVQLQAMRAYAGPENNDWKRLLAELSSLKSELTKMESGNPNQWGERQDNSQAMQNARLFRDLKFQESVYNAMLQQFTLATADAAKEGPLVQAVDVAKPPERKSKPKRLQILLISALAGLFGGLIVAFVRSMWRRAKQDPDTASQFSTMRAAWSLRGG